MRSLIITSLFGSLLCCGLATADDISGPHRQTLADESWGSLYYVPTKLKNYRYQRNTDNGSRSMQSSFGKVEIQETGIGSYCLVGPQGTIKVSGSSSKVEVEDHGKKFYFVRDGVNFKVVGEKKPLNFINQGPNIRIEGAFGTTLIEEKNGNYHVTSPKGTYDYIPSADGGFEVKGGPLASHPGLFRGALFEMAGVGVFIDFKKMDPESPLFRFLEFGPMLEHLR